MPAHKLRRPGFRGNFAWNFAGTSLYNLAQWALIVALTHISSPRDVGTFSLMLATAAPVFLTIGMNLRTVQATDVAGAFRLEDHLGLRLILNSISILATILIGLALGLRDQDVLALGAVGLAKSVETVSQSYYGYFQLHERLDLVSRSLIARSILGPLIFILGYTLTDSLIGAALGLATGWGIVQLTLDRRNAQALHTQYSGRPISSPFPIHRATMRNLVKLAAPLGIDAGLSSLAINAPRYIVQVVLGASQLALYATLAYLAQAISMITSAMAAVIVPRLALHHHHGERRKFVRLLGGLVSFGLAVAAACLVGALILGRPLLELILDPDYVRMDILLPLMVGAGATTLQRSLCKALEAAQRFGSYVRVDLVTTLGIIVSGIPLTYFAGVPGAAWSLTVGFSAGCVVVAFSLADIIRNFPERTTS